MAVDCNLITEKQLGLEVSVIVIRVTIDLSRALAELIVSFGKLPNSS